MEAVAEQRTTLDVLHDSILNCRDCHLRPLKSAPVPFIGPANAEVVIVGEAAGENEIAKGEPFIGKAGYLLNQCLSEAGFSRSQCYITNVVKCRPTVGSKDRPPTAKEVKACVHFLHDELAEVKPRLVILLGNTPLSVFTRKSKITEMRGKPIEIGDTIYFPTFHPSYILRMPAYRQTFVSDLRRARAVLEGDVLEINPNVVSVCLTKEQADAAVAGAMQAEACAIDTETTGLLPWSGQRVLCAAVAYGENKVFAVPMTKWGIEALRPLLASEDVKKVFHNVKFDVSFLEKYGLTVNRVAFDCCIAAHLLNENRSLKLEHLAVEELGCKPWKEMATWADFVNWRGAIEELIPTEDENYPLLKAEQGLMDKFYQLMQYNGMDALLTLYLYQKLRPQLLKQERFLNIFGRVSMPIFRALQDCERLGMRVDVKYLEEYRAELELQIAEKLAGMNDFIPDSFKEKKRMDFEENLWNHIASLSTVQKKATKLELPLNEVVAAEFTKRMEAKPYEFEFNWNSGKQLGDLLYTADGLNLPIMGKTESGAPSCDEDTLVQLMDTHPVAALRALLDYRSLVKLVSTYISPWLEVRDAEDRVHTTFNITGTVTGRLSSSNPLNLQNVPREKRVKNAFIAAPGWKLVQADYSQLELRVAAQVAPEFTLRQLYQEGIDVHTRTAAAITGKDEADILKEERSCAKAVNFGFLYGMSAAGFTIYAKTQYGLNLTQEEAQMFRDRFFQAYPMLVDWHNRMKMLVIKNQFVDTVFGRRRRLPDAASTEMGLRNAAIREGTNMVVQSVAADITLSSMIRLRDLFDPEEARIIATVHDSIMVEAREEVADMIAAFMEDIMANPPTEEWFGYRWNVPLAVDVKIGDKWGEL